MISNNIYIDDFIKKIIFFKQNSLCEKITSEIAQIDPVIDFADFKRFVSKEILERTKRHNKAILYSIRYGEEGEWYGHRRSIIDYSDIRLGSDRYLMPNIWHGAEFVGYDSHKERFSTDIQYLITMSDYHIDQIHAIRPWLQVYPIGPYIYYAQGFYEKGWVKSTKKKNGRTALYFPQHSTETTSVNFDESVACKNINYLMTKYDTILVSVYWTDVDDPIYDYYHDKGAKLVSSGVRSDVNFIRRQRSLYELADDVYGNALGTNLGYAMAMGKPYYFFNDDIKIIGNRISSEYMGKIEERDNEIKCIWNRNNDAEKKLIFEKYWGGIKHIKTKEEIKSILDIQQKLLRMSHGNILKIDRIIESIVENGKQYDFLDDEIRLISNAVFCP